MTSKKLFAALAVTALTVTLAACGMTTDTPADDDTINGTTPTTTPDTTLPSTDDTGTMTVPDTTTTPPTDTTTTPDGTSPTGTTTP